jgi:CSLREA domain-containing protein
MTTERLSLAVALALIFASSPLAAATITVTTTVDELNVDNDCSLREAIVAATPEETAWSKQTP